MTTLTADWLTRPATQRVCRALTDAGAQALFVGGCVRNTLLGVPVSDIDIATDAVPETVISIAEAAGLRAVPTGIDHGTVTVVADGIPHELTTFRRDVETDGRRAVVAFSIDVTHDAQRRDFTMNALYATPTGQVVDPLNGLPDLQARRVRFIGNPHDRIREDHLRSLRFFRFHAWYGDAAQGMDADALAAIADHLDGIDTLSRERVGAEMLKLLGAPDPTPSIATMRQIGLLARCLPGANDRPLGPLVHIHPEPDAVMRLAALGRDFDDPLRLSKSNARRARLLRDAAEGTDDAPTLGYRIGADDAGAARSANAATASRPLPEAQISVARSAATQVFPVTASDLMPDFQGPELGTKLRELEDAWIASGFDLSKADLVARAKGG